MARIRRIVLWFRKYVLHLYWQMDPLTERQFASSHFSPSHLNFISFLLLISIYFYGIIVHQLASDLPISLTELKESPVIFTHQAVPQSIWPQVDFEYILATFFSAFIYLALLFIEDVDHELRLSIDGERVKIGTANQLGTTVSDIIIRNSRRLKSKLLGFIGIVYWSVVLSEGAYFWLFHVHKATWFAVAFWGCLFPVYFFYHLHCKYGHFLMIF